MKKQNGAGKYTDLIMKAIDEKPISSLPDIKKWITRNCDYNTSSCKNFRYINKSLKTLVDDGTLVKVKGKWRCPPQKNRPKSDMKKHTAKKANRAPKARLYSASAKHISRVLTSTTGPVNGTTPTDATAWASWRPSLSIGCVGAGTLSSDSRRCLVFSFMIDS